MAQYIVGSQVPLGVLFFDENGTPTDPTAITFKFRTPTGTTTTYTYGTDAELVKDSTGKYHVTLTASAAGQWLWRFAGTGTVVAALQGSFDVEVSPLA